MRYLCATYQFRWLHSPHLTNLRDLLGQLHDSPDPDIQRLLILFERDRQRATAARYGKSHRERTPKLDLDYDPHHNGNGDDDDDYCDNYDNDFDADEAVDAAMAKMSPAQIMGIFEKMFSDPGRPGLENLLDLEPEPEPEPEPELFPGAFSDPFAGRKPPSKPPKNPR
jgi:hypothetical protein